MKDYHIFLTHSIVLHVISKHVKLYFTEIPEKWKKKKIGNGITIVIFSIVFTQSFLSQKECHRESKLAKRTAKLNGSKVKPEMR